MELVWRPARRLNGSRYGNKITMHALVAKNPAAMTKGATSVYTYQGNGETLMLTQVRTHSGASAAPATIKLMRVE